VRDGHAHRSPALRFATLLTAALVLLALAPAAPAAETAECANLSPCTSLPNTPWVAIPAAKRGYDEENQILDQAGTVQWRVECPVTEVPAGRDFNVQGEEGQMIVSAFLPPFNGGLTGSPFAFFFGYSQAGEPNSFQPLVGCIPKETAKSARAAVAAKSGGRTVRTVVRRIEAGQDKTFTHRCAKGERLLDSAHGVGFYTRKPPTRRELGDLEVERTERGNRIAVHVRTGSSAGDRERVELQIHATCR